MTTVKHHVNWRPTAEATLTIECEDCDYIDFASSWGPAKQLATKHLESGHGCESTRWERQRLNDAETLDYWRAEGVKNIEVAESEPTLIDLVSSLILSDDPRAAAVGALAAAKMIGSDETRALALRRFGELAPAEMAQVTAKLMNPTDRILELAGEYLLTWAGEA